MKYTEEEEEWEEEDVVVLSDKDECVDNEENEGILFDQSTRVSKDCV